MTVTVKTQDGSILYRRQHVKNVVTFDAYGISVKYVLTLADDTKVAFFAGPHHLVVVE